jgi:uncharacterized iron-regulated membrane protein
MPVPGQGNTREQQVTLLSNHILAKLTPKFGAKVADQYSQSFLQFAKAHPNITASQAYVGWFLVTSKINSKLGKAIAAELGASGQFTKDALASLGPAFGKFDIFNGINFGNWLMRGGEILIGVVLIGVGVAKLTGTQNIISKIAKVPL